MCIYPFIDFIRAKDGGNQPLFFFFLHLRAYIQTKKSHDLASTRSCCYWFCLCWIFVGKKNI